MVVVSVFGLVVVVVFGWFFLPFFWGGGGVRWGVFLFVCLGVVCFIYFIPIFI